MSSCPIGTRLAANTLCIYPSSYPSIAEDRLTVPVSLQGRPFFFYTSRITFSENRAGLNHPKSSSYFPSVSTIRTVSISRILSSSGLKFLVSPADASIIRIPSSLPVSGVRSIPLY